MLAFDPKDYIDTKTIKVKLGYGTEPLIVCSTGGTSVGKELLSLCADAYPLVKEKIPNLKMVIACGPHVDPNYIHAVEGLEVKGYVPQLFEHFAAADLCIVTGGGTTTLELITLNKAFLYFPLLKHFEQQRDVAWKCERLNAGIKMNYATTSKEVLAKAIQENIGKKVNYPSVPIDGAQKAAELINEFLDHQT